MDVQPSNEELQFPICPSRQVKLVRPVMLDVPADPQVFAAFSASSEDGNVSTTSVDSIAAECLERIRSALIVIMPRTRRQRIEGAAEVVATCDSMLSLHRRGFLDIIGFSVSSESIEMAEERVEDDSPRRLHLQVHVAVRDGAMRNRMPASDWSGLMILLRDAGFEIPNEAISQRGPDYWRSMPAPSPDDQRMEGTTQQGVNHIYEVAQSRSIGDQSEDSPLSDQRCSSFMREAAQSLWERLHPYQRATVRWMLDREAEVDDSGQLEGGTGLFMRVSAPSVEGQAPLGGCGKRAVRCTALTTPASRGSAGPGGRHGSW